jgi:class 3 adenylate cyclase
VTPSSPSSSAPNARWALLDQIVTEFDRLAAVHGVEKIKTTGDGYMAVAGVSRAMEFFWPLRRLQLPKDFAKQIQVR